MMQLLPYHLRVIEYFKKQASLWSYFSNHSEDASELTAYKTELLKNSYRFDPVSDHALYQLVEQAKSVLGLDNPVILYQAQNTSEINATVHMLGTEVHIVFTGALLSILNEEEQLAVIGHELAHVHLYTQLSGFGGIADRIMTAIASRSDSSVVHYETARRFKLYTEIFCDRGAYETVKDYRAVISSLVKIATGLSTINADNYIKQAEMIFSSASRTTTEGITHPENFIRARALHLWHEQRDQAEEMITQMIEGDTGLDALDILRQEDLRIITRKVIDKLLSPAWMRTERNLTFAQQYFPGYTIAASVDNPPLQIEPTLHSSLNEYLAYLLYDFGVVDNELEDLPLGNSYAVSEQLGISTGFKQVLKKERRLTDKKVDSLLRQALLDVERLANSNEN